MARLYADENFPLPVVDELRTLGHDVLTVYDDGRANQRLSDAAILAVAIDYKRAILTTNRRHFIRLHMASQEHSGIVVCTYDPDFGRQARRIDEALADSVLENQLIRVNRP